MGSFQVKFTYREFTYDPQKYSELMSLRQTLELEVKKQELFLIKLDNYKKCITIFAQLVFTFPFQSVQGCFLRCGGGVAALEVHALLRGGRFKIWSSPELCSIYSQAI